MACSAQAKTKDKSPIFYVEHCNPHTDPDYYENARTLYGGDDFALRLPANWLEMFEAHVAKHPRKWKFSIRLSTRSASLIL